jgi:CubicO group peptidase (beta-lactamase class C family)
MRSIAALLIIICLSSCWVMRAYRIRKMNLTDHKKLPSVHIQKPDTPFQFIDGANDAAYHSLKQYLDSNLERTKTAGFLVIRNDSILYEKYFDGFGPDDLLPSNSVAKSFTGTLIAIAHQEGKIRSLSDPMTNYIPELLKRDSAFRQVTIQHLLDMRTGFDLREGSYDLKDDAIRLGLRPNVKKHLLKIKIAQPPGRFRYQSANTQFLGWIIERATGKKLYEYLEEKLWKPLGAEHDATWNVDSRKRKTAFASAGLNATIRDFAKLGQLYINRGQWNGRQLLDSGWIAQLSIDTLHLYDGYKNQWWNRRVSVTFSNPLPRDAHARLGPYVVTTLLPENRVRLSYRVPAFSAIGFLNQYIYVHPQKRIVMVRIGKRWSHPGISSTQFIYGLGERL